MLLGEPSFSAVPPFADAAEGYGLRRVRGVVIYGEGSGDGTLSQRFELDPDHAALAWLKRRA